MAKSLEVKTNTPDKLVITSSDQGGGTPKRVEFERHKEGKRNLDIYIGHGGNEEKIYLNTAFTVTVRDWLNQLLDEGE